MKLCLFLGVFNLKTFSHHCAYEELSNIAVQVDIINDSPLLLKLLKKSSATADFSYHDF